MTGHLFTTERKGTEVLKNLSKSQKNNRENVKNRNSRFTRIRFALYFTANLITKVPNEYLDGEVCSFPLIQNFSRFRKGYKWLKSYLFL